MTFDDHIRENCTKAMKRVTVLKRLHSKLPRKSKLTVYTAFIRPIIEFGWQLYDNSPLEHLDTLEQVQRQALLTVTSAYKKTSHTSLLKEVGLPLLSKRRVMLKIKFMYRHTENKLPVYLQEVIPNTVDTVSNYNLRNKNDICMPKSKKNYFLKSFIPSSIKVWNETREDIKLAATTTTLQAKLSVIYGNSSNSMFLYGEGKGAINHSRMRMGLSALNAQRKKYHFIPDGDCENCNAKVENVTHYFLECPSYTALRQQLLQELNHNVPELIQPLNNFSTNKQSASKLIKILISGTENSLKDKLIFDSVQHFVKESTRF